MTKDEIRQALLESTVDTIAKHGFGGATTKAIASPHGINEAYIYRCFGGKEKMFAAAFDQLDHELLDAIVTPVSPDATYDSVESLLHAIFERTWRFVLRNRERCLFYVRYYFSPYFLELSHLSHMATYRKLIAEMTPLFRDHADVTSLLHHVLSSLLDFAVRVYNGDISDSDSTATHVFRVLYSVFHPYLRETTF